MAEIQDKLRELVPELKVAVAHGQMSAKQLEEVMQAFYEGKYDVLLATTIIESGLDVTNANTMIIDRAHLFGLAQLYQLRGRVGRGKTRAYAYFIIPSKKKLTDHAVRRLEVMHNLDTLGAGFTLASHDMDIRGFGNLLGEEQSGHVREVGVELYQHMLEEAIRQQRSGVSDAEEEEWSPAINLGTSLLIPESYVEALDVRMQLYRRMSSLKTQEEVDAFAAELIDRFGTLPEEVRNLLDSMNIRNSCHAAGIERLDTGPKGAVITFRHNQFVKPEALLRHITQHPKQYKIRSDQKLVYLADWKNPQQRMQALGQLAAGIAALAV
jgi:transcription-repair coupling factor (superfamily II helicase)